MNSVGNLIVKSLLGVTIAFSTWTQAAPEYPKEKPTQADLDEFFAGFEQLNICGLILQKALLALTPVTDSKRTMQLSQLAYFSKGDKVLQWRFKNETWSFYCG